MIEKARILIQQGDILTAIESMNQIIPEAFRNDLILLSSQFHSIERQQRMNLPHISAERNRIIYALLYLISETEQDRNENNADRRRAKLLSSHEIELSKAYSYLSQIRKPNLIDYYFMWMLENESELFQELILAENTDPHPQLFIQSLTLDLLQQLIVRYQLRVTKEAWYELLIKRHQEVPKFLSGWKKYNQYRMNYDVDLVQAIEKTKKMRTQTMVAGTIGLLIGGIVASTFRSPIRNTIEKYSEGEDTTEGDEEDSYDDIGNLE